MTEEANNHHPEQNTTFVDSLRSRFQKSWWMRRCLDVIIITAMFIAVTLFQTRNMLGSGKQAPDFTLQSTTGQSYQLSALNGGKVLIVFWAPWCGVCKVESSNISAIHQAYQKDDSVTVISIVLGYNNLQEVKDFMTAHDVDYPVLLGDKQLNHDYKIDVFPTAYIISPNGEIEDGIVGYTSEFGLRWRLWL